LSQVSASLLAPNDLDEGRLQQLLGSLMSHQVEFGDLYFQRSWHESWMLEDGIVRMAATTSIRGGVRAVSGEKTGFAYSDELSLLALQQSVTAARGIAAAGAQGKVKAWARTEANLLYPALDPADPRQAAENCPAGADGQVRQKPGSRHQSGDGLHQRGL
jgi:TldD protein